MPSTWFFPVLEDPLPLDWRQDLDRLHALILEELEAQNLNISGSQFGTRLMLEEHDVYHFAMSVRSKWLSSELCFIPVSPGAVVLLIQRESSLPETEIQPWVRALARALRRLRDPLPEQEWWAVIGPSEKEGAGQRLGGPTTIGQMSLTPAASSYTEIVESTVGPSLFGGEIRESMPVVVHGTAPGQTHLEVQTEASRRLHGLCAVLSVAWEGAWTVRHTPGPLALDPSALPRSRWGVDVPGHPNPGQTTEVTVPPWIESALNRLEGDPKLREATLAHHQGLTMEDRHPSYALLAYVAVIEGFGARYVKSGSSQKFRCALRLVCSDEEADRLGRAYDVRSKTAHAGRLHGGEDLAGAVMSMRVVAPEDWRLFQLLNVVPLRKASHDLLLLGLTGTLPPPESLLGATQDGTKLDGK